MRTAEDELIGILKRSGVNLISSLPCERVRSLLLKVENEFEHIPLSREEAGVGISAGAALAGKRPAMIIQNSGIGNMINALLSLTSFYGLPLSIFLSHRGVYKEKIAAQVPMGKHVGGILKAAGIGYTNIKNADELNKIIRPLERVYNKNLIHAFLISPKVWEDQAISGTDVKLSVKKSPVSTPGSGPWLPKAKLTRFEVLKEMERYLDGKLVICNLGFPAKELYRIIDQPSNFYMLGSMGMATPIGFGTALSCKKEVIVIDGDGSILMNPSTLSAIAGTKPNNLTIILIDNGVYSSTGDQPTTASTVANLSVVARGFGLRNIYTVSDKKEIESALRSKKKGPKFVHIIAKKGNEILPIIPLSAEEIKKRFMRSVAS